MIESSGSALARYLAGPRDIHADGLPYPQRLWATLATLIGTALSVIDGTIANVALPAIAGHMNVSPAASIWIVNAYQLAVVICLLPLASLGEMLGYRRVYLSGLALFTVASLCCALSQNLLFLTLSRVLQGFGAAALMSTSPALIRFIHPAARLGRAISYNAVVVAVSAALGPTVAAAILSLATWPWLFAVNLPLGIAAFCLGIGILPRNRLTTAPFDVAGALLCALTIGLFIVGIDGMGHGGRIGPAMLALAVAATAGFVLVRMQKGRASPMVPVDLFRRPIFTLSIATSITSFVAQSLALVSLPFLFNRLSQGSAIEIGLLITPWPLTTAVVAPIAGRLADRYPAGLMGGIGLAGLSIGLALLAMLPNDPALADVVWRMSICGMGFGMFQSPNNRAILGSVPRSRAGSAGGMLATARLTGQTCGAALVALIFSRFSATSGSGPDVALWVGALSAAIAAVASSLRLFRFAETVAE